MNEEHLNQLLEELKQEWSYPDGFFVKARFGTMDSDGYNRVISILEKVYQASQEDKTLDRELVLSLWHIPEFLKIQDNRIYKTNQQTASKHWGNWCSRIHHLISKIFGLDMDEANQKLLDSQEELRKERECNE